MDALIGFVIYVLGVVSGIAGTLIVYSLAKAEELVEEAKELGRRS